MLSRRRSLLTALVVALPALLPSGAQAAQAVIRCPSEAQDVASGPWTATLPLNQLYSATWHADTREVICMYAVPVDPRPVFFLFRRSTPARCVMSFATGTNARILTSEGKPQVCEVLRETEDAKRGECVAVCQTD